MTIRITAVRLSGGTEHEHISHLWWTTSTGENGDAPRANVVSWIESGGAAYVDDANGARTVQVGVITPAFGPKYLRTYADNTWTNNLLALPRR